MSFTTRRVREGKPTVSQRLLKVLPAMLRVGGAMVGLYGVWKKEKDTENSQKKLWRVLKILLIVIVSVIVVSWLAMQGVKALVKMHIITPGTFSSLAGTDPPQDANGYTNLLLLGTGDENHDGVDLTDTLMLASIDPGTTGSVVLLSIPRDLYVMKTAKMGSSRINELYRNYKYYIRRNEKLDEAEASQKAMKELAAEIGRKLGVEIHHVAKVDFTAFVDSVDALGGVDIEVPQDIVDPEYPGPNYSYETFSITQGSHHLDGETALKYARSRHTTSDFDRAARQQQLLQALAEKARAEGIITSPGKIFSFLKIISEHLETTMPVSEMIGSARFADDIQRDRIITMQLNDRTFGYVQPGGFLYSPPREEFGGASVLLPYALPPATTNWDQIRALVHMLVHNRPAYIQPTRISVLNGGARNGLAGLISDELSRYGFPVSETANATADGKAPKDDQKRETSVIVASSPADEEMAEFFSGLLQIPTGPAPIDLPPEKIAPVTIILGKDYEFKAIQTLLALPAEELPPPDEPETSSSGTLLDQ